MSDMEHLADKFAAGPLGQDVPKSHDWQTLRHHADTAFLAHGATLTPLREAVLAELCAAGKPLRAYDLAENLNRRSGRNTAVNSVYRVLSRCLDVGLVRRVESRHAYIVVQDDKAKAAMFLLCDQCGT